VARGRKKKSKTRIKPDLKPQPAVTVDAARSVSGPGGGTRGQAQPPTEAAENRPMAVRKAFGFITVGRMDFVGRRRFYYIFSGVLLLMSVLSLAIQGLNLGIDFTGGNSYSLEFSQPVQEAQVRGVLERQGVMGSVVRIDKEDPRHVLIRTPYMDAEGEEAMMASLASSLGEVTAEAGEVVSPTISGELFKTALIGTLLACLGILIYVAVRFEYRFGAAAVVALVHDTLITVGVFSLLRLEVNSAFVAAILTIIGYSVNDTIVVFDRVRDNLKRRGKEGLDSLVNRSINETFVRSINTSATAFLAITAIFLFGGATTRDFSLALMVGVFIGTYSSICVASPVWLWWRKRDEGALTVTSTKSQAAKGRG